MSRVCSCCQIEKEMVEFTIGKEVRGQCRECRNKKRLEMSRRYKEKAADIKKTCTLCSVEKCGTDFPYASNICKPCLSVKDSEANNKPAEDAPPKSCSKCSKEQPAQQYRFRSNICRTCEKDRLYVWREKNPEKFKEICQRYRDKDDYREKHNTYLRGRYTEDTNFKLETLYRARVRCFIKGGIKKGHEKYTEMLGCSWDTLRKWLESNFSPEMNWENYGSLWHVDHTMPCASFDMTDAASVNACFNWSNLAPMIGVENISKSDKINMKLINTMKERARHFIHTHPTEIVTQSLPEDLKAYCGALDTKVVAKSTTGSGETSEVR